MHIVEIYTYIAKRVRPTSEEPKICLYSISNTLHVLPQVYRISANPISFSIRLVRSRPT
jgi:hypothetical protein